MSRSASDSNTVPDLRKWQLCAPLVNSMCHARLQNLAKLFTAVFAVCRMCSVQTAALRTDNCWQQMRDTCAYAGLAWNYSMQYKQKALQLALSVRCPVNLWCTFNIASRWALQSGTNCAVSWHWHEFKYKKKRAFKQYSFTFLPMQRQQKSLPHASFFLCPYMTKTMQQKCLSRVVVKKCSTLVIARSLLR